MAAIDAGRIVVRVEPDTSKVGPAVRGAADDAAAQAEPAVQRAGARMRQIGTTASLALTAPIAAGAYSAVQAAGDTVESVNKVGVVFDEQAPAVERFADKAAEAFGISRREALDAAGVYGNLFRSMGIGAGKSADMSTELVGLAGDLASFNNIDPNEALDKLRAGLAGETEPLRTLGVNLNAARIEAEAFALGLAEPTKNAAKIETANVRVAEATRAYNEAVRESGKDSLDARKAHAQLSTAQDQLKSATAGSKTELTAAQKAQATYSLIMKDSELAQGDFQRSLGDSAANQERVSKALADNAQANLGETLLPLYRDLVTGAGKVAGAVASLPGPARQGAVALLAAGAAAGPLLTVGGNLIRVGGGIGSAFTSTAGTVRKFGEGFRDARVGMSAFASRSQKLGGQARQLGGALVNAGSSAGRSAKGIAQSGAAAGRAAAGHVRARVATIAHAAAQRTAAVATRVFAVASRVAAVALRGVGVALRFAMGPVGLVIAGIGLLVAAFVMAYKRSETFRRIVHGAIAGVAKVGRAIMAGFAAAFRAIWAGLVAVVTGYVRVYKAVVTGVFRAVVAVISAALRAGKAVVSAIWRGVVALVRGYVAVYRAVISAAFRAAVAVIRGALNAARAVASAVWSAIVAVVRTAVTGALRIVRGLAALGGKFASWFGAAKDAALNALGRLLDFVTSLPGKITSALGNLGSLLADKGRDVISGFVSGLKSMAGSVVSAVKSTITDKLPAFVRNRLGIASPSKVFRKIGRQVTAGLVKGIDESARDIRKASREIAKSIRDAFEDRGATRADDIALRVLRRNTDRLVGIARRRDRVSKRLEAARKRLADRRKAAREFVASTAKRVTDTGDVTQLGAYSVTGLTEQLRRRVSAAQEFAGNLDTLRRRNVDPRVMRQLAEAGVEQGAAMAAALASASPRELGTVKALQDQLAAAGKAAGRDARRVLHNPGVQAARGLVRGLESQEKRLERVMRKIGRRIARTLRRVLKIRSPSGVTRELGELTGEGFARGIGDREGDAHAAMRRLVSLPRTDLNGTPAAAGAGVSAPVTVYAAPGMSEGELAHATSRELAWRMSGLAAAGGTA